MSPPGRGTVFAAGAFTIGLLLAPERAPHLLILIPSLFLLLLVLLLQRLHSAQVLRTLAFAFLFASIGWALGHQQSQPPLPDGRVWIEGTVRIPVEQYDDRLRYRLSVHRWWSGEYGGSLDLGAVVYLPDTLRLEPGEDVRLIGSFAEFTGPRNPGDIDWRGYWANRDVQASIRAVRLVEPLGVGGFFGGWTRQLIGGWRQSVDRLIREDLTGASQPLAQALLIGDRSRWDQILHDRVAQSGLMHLFAISGLHVGLMVIIAISALSLLGLGPRITALLSLPLLWLLVPLTGTNPPVLRAAIIITVAVVGRALQRNSDPFHILALSYLLMLFLSPGGLSDPGFQLSFAGTAGTLHAGKHFRFLLSPAKKYATSSGRFIHHWWRRLLLALVVSIYAWLATMPIIVADFGRLPLLGPIATLPALLTVTLSLVAGWLMVALSWWPWLASVFGAAMDVLLRLTNWLADFSSTGLPALDHLPLASAILAGIVLVLALLLTRSTAKRPLAGWSLITLIAAVTVVIGSLWLPDTRVKLAILDVGQGDSILIRSGRHAILIDTGPEVSTAAADQLRRLGIDRLDLLLLSHGDADHCGSVPELTKQVEVEVALVGPGTIRDIAGLRAVRALHESGAVVHIGQAGQTLTGPWGELRCVYPADTAADPLLSDNALSLVWIWRCESAAALFQGDAPQKVEHALTEAGGIPEVNLLLAGHHGSRFSTSLEWLGALEPEIVAVSCGRDNAHGHPAPEVINRIQNSGAEILRTDQQGALLFEILHGRLKPISQAEWW